MDGKRAALFSCSVVLLASLLLPVNSQAVQAKDSSTILLLLPAVIGHGGGTCSSGMQIIGTEWGLQMQRCDDNVKYNWTDAQAYCENLSLSGHTDWRLPTVDELTSLRVCSTGVYVDSSDPQYSRCNDDSSSPTIDPSFQCHESYYWTAINYNGNEDYAWGVHFGSGEVQRISKNWGTYTRCVRGGGP